jgi:hypothetical protein
VPAQAVAGEAGVADAADAVGATVCADVAMGQAVDAVAVRVPVLAQARIRAEAEGPVRTSRRLPRHRLAKAKAYFSRWLSGRCPSPGDR